ncbi:MAG: aminomethyltransferase family protein [Myxococcota bacterium]
MPATTPFHDRIAPLVQTGIWKHWSGYLVPPAYQSSLATEYWAIRSAVSVLDTSPLFKYRFTGPGARPLLARMLARDIGQCAVGRAQYTCWCNPAGFVLQDGVALHIAEHEYLLTAAEPALRYFRTLARSMGVGPVEIEDVSTAWGILALQGPHAHDLLAALTPDITPLRYFGLTRTTIAGSEVIVSRTGYTGDLGYELWIPAANAGTVWDALAREGEGHNLTPIGTTALKMSRVEAGLLLLGVDFNNAQLTWVDAERDTPLELGWGWMFRRLDSDERDFIGREAIEAAQRERTSRWMTVGLAVDWHDYERVYTEAGILPPRHEVYAETTMSVYRRSEIPWDYAGYASSFLSSSLLRRPIALAKLPLDLAAPGTQVELEVTVIRRPHNVLARVVETPFFSPARKTASMRPSTTGSTRPRVSPSATPPVNPEGPA